MDLLRLLFRVNVDSIVLLDLGRDRLENLKARGICPLNIYQGVAMHAHLDPNLDLDLLIGTAESSKTFLSLACVLNLVVGQRW